MKLFNRFRGNSKHKSKRLFVGSPMSADFVAVGEGFRSKHAHLRGVKWEPNENYHVTLYFLGEVLEGQVENVCTLIDALVEGQQAFKLKTRAICYPPVVKNPRMFWIRFDKSDEFSAWVQEMDRVFQQIVPKQKVRKNPTPHMTLGRLRNFNQYEEVNFSWALPEAYLLNEVVLWESILLPKGARYVPLKRWRL